MNQFYDWYEIEKQLLSTLAWGKIEDPNLNHLIVVRGVVHTNFSIEISVAVPTCSVNHKDLSHERPEYNTQHALCRERGNSNAISEVARYFAFFGHSVSWTGDRTCDPSGEVHVASLFMGSLSGWRTPRPIRATGMPMP